MKKIYKSCDFSIENNPDKNYLQRFLYSISEVKGSATVVSGIAIDRHIEDYKNFISYFGSKQNILDIIEIDKSIYNKIKLQIKSRKDHIQINVINADITYYNKLRRFVDADLTKSLASSLPIFKILFMKMHENGNRKGFKHALICTYCKRAVSGNEIIKALNNITSLSWKKNKTFIQLPLINYERGAYLLRTDYSTLNYKCIAFSYRFKDSSPMVSLIIKW
jgi:hypothetical protein